MKRIFTLIILVGTMLASANAQTKTEDRWVEAARSMDKKTTLYVDAQTLRRDGNTLLVWEKFADRDGSYRLRRFQIRRDRQCRPLSGVDYDAGGEMTYSFSDPAGWQEMPPDSMQDFVNRYFDGLMKLAAPKDPPAVRY